MKRKALITATAVLLVAVMCLATASYAWFTAGKSASIDGFEFKIEQGDAALQLAPVDMRDHSNVGKYTNSLSSGDWGEYWSIQSTTFIPVSSENGVKGTFFPVDAYNETNETWTSLDPTGEGYLYFVFSVKAPSAGSATLSFTAAGEGSNTFKSAAKLAVTVEGTETQVFDMDPDTDDEYQPMIAKGATCEKDEDGYFVPVAAAGFSTTKRSQTGVQDVTISFDGEGAKTVVVAYWVEGMDTDCSGSGWNLTAQSLELGLNWAAKTA